MKRKRTRKPKPSYFVDTWDTTLQKFTPQDGVPYGPYTLFGLRKAIRALRGMGYSANRLPKIGVGDCAGDPSVYIVRSP